MSKESLDDFFARFGITGKAIGVIMIVFGILILLEPRLLELLVALALIIVGILRLLEKR